MAFRFRNTIKIAPGIRLNLGKRGISISAGVRGATVTAGRNGIYGNVGLPGTGLSYRTRLDQSPAHRRRAERQQHRAEQERQRVPMTISLALDDKGNLLMSDADGNPVSTAARRRMWEQDEAQLSDWLTLHMEDINDDMDLLLNIHEDTPAPCSAPPEVITPSFADTKPIPPVVAMPVAAPQPPQRPEQRPWHRVSRRLAIRQQQRYRAANAQWREDTGQWQAAVVNAEAAREQVSARHRQCLSDWETARSTHLAEQKRMQSRFQEQLTSDERAMATVLDAELALLDWPRETLVDYQVDTGARHIDLDVDLPEIEAMPLRTAKFNVSGQRLLIKNKSQKQLRLEYARHVHGVILRLIGSVFATLPSIDTLTVSGYTQRLDSGTGYTDDDYILSARVTRSAFSALNFDNLAQVDPIAALDQFDLRRDMTKTGIIKVIEPFGTAPEDETPQAPG